MRRSSRLAKKQGLPVKPTAPFCPYKLGYFQAASHDNPSWCKYCNSPQSQDNPEREDTSSNIVNLIKQDVPTSQRCSLNIQAKEGHYVKDNNVPEMSEYDKVRQRNIEERQRKFHELQINEAKMAISSDVMKPKKSISATNMRLSEPPRRSARLQAKALCSAPEDEKFLIPPHDGMRAVARTYTSKRKLVIEGQTNPLSKDIPDGEFYSKDAQMKPNREVPN